MLRPLKLKVQRVAPPAGPEATELPLASVWVDSGIPFLTQPFSYLIPEKLSKLIQVGSRVQVPFKDKHLEGIVIERTAKPSDAGDLKSIYKLLGEYPVASQETLELISLVASYWGGTPYDVIRSAIPPRVVTAEKDLGTTRKNSSKATNQAPSFHLLPPKLDPIVALVSLILESKAKGARLVIVPTARELARLVSLLHEAEVDFVSLDSNLPRAQRYRNFLEASLGSVELIVGMRAAIFAPIPNLGEIFLHQENSEHYFERRTPYWSAREVAWIRAKLEKLDLRLTGYVPSLEIAMDIETKEVQYHATREKISVLAQPSTSGELIPSKIYKRIRTSLLEGPVLFLVPAKGYSSAISCAKCRNLALCECGGRLTKTSAKSEPICVLCSKKYFGWKCGWCGETRIFLTSRGIERIAEEIGRSFPNQLVIQSSGSDPREMVGTESALVISTPGAEPIAQGGYAAVVILQVDRFLSSTASNGIERAYSNFFAASALISSTGIVLLVHQDGAGIVSALTTWSPATIAKREIEARTELRLPPISSAILVLAEAVELQRIKRALENAIQEARAPSTLRIYGPAMTPNTDSGHPAKLTLLVEPNEQLELVSLLREINKLRAISNKQLLSFHVNPYSLD